MKYSVGSLVAAVFAGLASAHNHEILVNCRNDICYSMAVPEVTAQNGNGTIYFQMYAPDKFSWVAMGTGSRMADSNMFIMYQDGAGNVTLSGRQATGHTMPTVPTTGAPQLTLLEGSGVEDGFMIANFACSNCHAWKTNTLDFTSDSTPMIGAWSEGDPIDSDSPAARIGVHTGSPRIFEFDLSEARLSNTTNPFVGAFAVPEEIAGNGTAEEDGDENAAVGGRGVLAQSLVFGSALLCAMSLIA